MEVVTLVIGPISTNCYLVSDPQTKETIVIDVGSDGADVIRNIKALGLKPKYVISTHGHFDHTLGSWKVAKEFSVPFLLHHLDEFLLNDNPPQYLQEGDLIEAGCIALKVVHTPGHTPGGIMLVGDNVAFAGDNVFAGGYIGRTDLPGASYQQLIDSIRHKIFVLPDSTVLYPGHGGSTTVGLEKKYNTYVKS